MSGDPTLRRTLRFACTQCGACCNRSPEVALSEATALADVFVFRLMYRLYELPNTLAGYRATATNSEPSDAFFESKRLLAAFAARKTPGKRRIGGKVFEYTKYLTISALTLDSGSGACSALRDGRCGIYPRRPLACRTVPFHYSRPEASAERDFEAFVGTPGYRCDTGADAPPVLESGRIASADWKQTRSAALTVAENDRRWQEAIVRRLRGSSGYSGLPGLREIENGAAFGATTTSMRIAWQIAVEAGLLDAETCRALVQAQAAVIARQLAAASCGPAARETLAQMGIEYRQLQSH